VSSQFAAWFLERIFDLLMALLIFGFALTRVVRLGRSCRAKAAAVLAVGGRLAAFPPCSCWSFCCRCAILPTHRPAPRRRAAPAPQGEVPKA